MDMASDDKLVELGVALKRIQRDDTGEIGGWIEKESNLSLSGNAWVSGNALVHGNAEIADPHGHVAVGPIGSRQATLTWTRSDNCIATGCFRGTVEEFRKAVKATHGANEHGKAYRAVLRLIKVMREARS